MSFLRISAKPLSVGVFTMLLTFWCCWCCSCEFLLLLLVSLLNVAVFSTVADCVFLQLLLAVLLLLTSMMFLLSLLLLSSLMLNVSLHAVAGYTTFQASPLLLASLLCWSPSCCFHSCCCFLFYCCRQSSYCSHPCSCCCWRSCCCSRSCLLLMAFLLLLASLLLPAFLLILASLPPNFSCYFYILYCTMYSRLYRYNGTYSSFWGSNTFIHVSTLFYKQNICQSFHLLFSGRHYLLQINVPVEVRSTAGNFDTLGKKFVGGFWSA